MSFLMGCQVRTLSKPLETGRESTNIWLLPRMRPNVGSQVKVQAKFLSANLTSERLLSRMHQVMSLQFRIIKEFLATALDGTNELSLSVGQLMFS